MHGLGHSLQIPCSVGNWSGWCPMCQDSFCFFFLTVICCSILVETNSVMSMAFGCGAASGAPSCPSCALLCDSAFPLNFRCWMLPPLRSCHSGRQKFIRISAAVPIAAAAQCRDLPCWPSHCFLALSPPGDCADRLPLPNNSSCWWSSRHHGPYWKGTLLWSCAVPPPVQNPTSAIRRGKH